MAEATIIRYVNDLDINRNNGNQKCHSKPVMTILTDDKYKTIVTLCPPRYNIEIIHVMVKYDLNFDFNLGGEVKLKGFQLLENDKVWLSNQLDISENGIYIVKQGSWEFYRVVDDNVFVDLGVRVFDQNDGDLTRNVIIQNNINFNEIGIYSINYYVLNSSGILTQNKRIIRITRCNASIVPIGNFNITDYSISNEIPKDLLLAGRTVDLCNVNLCDDNTELNEK